MLLAVLLLFAQVETSHFTRPKMPHHNEWKCCMQLEYDEPFTIPKSGKWTLRYESLYPATYDGKGVKASPAFRDRKEPGFGNQEPIYDVDESYDHITVQAKPGTHWWYHVVIAVPKPPQAVLH